MMRLLLETGAALESKHDKRHTAFSASARSCDEYYLGSSSMLEPIPTPQPIME